MAQRSAGDPRHVHVGGKCEDADQNRTHTSRMHTDRVYRTGRLHLSLILDLRGLRPNYTFCIRVLLRGC